MGRFEEQYAAYREVAQDSFAIRSRLGISQSERQKLYVDSLVIFPLEIELSVGDNDAGFPVIREGTQLTLSSFHRANMLDSANELARQVARSYLSLGWLEVYKLIGSLDALGSPLAFVNRIAAGISAVLLAPWADLILDDSPGSFLVTFAKGLFVLLKNVTDAVFISVHRSMGGMAFACSRAALDRNYHKVHMDDIQF